MITISGYRFNLIASFLIASATLPLSAAVRFENFASTQGLELVGDAAISGKALRLTLAKKGRIGAAWLREKQPISAGFQTAFQFQLTHQARFLGGADGFAFVLQNSGPQALGGHGSAGGFGVGDANYSHHPGIPWSFAVFFDTWRNTNEGDPSDNYVAVRVNGRPAEMRWPAERLAFTPKLSVSLKDRRVHTARIVFERPVLQVFLDDDPHPVLQTAVDFSLVTDSEGKAWIGFTASTGWGFENHDILNWSFRGEEVSSNISVVSSEISFPMSSCLPNYNLCTPERPFVSGEGTRYHVVLPANLEWGVRVPNTDNGKALVTNAHGTVCWDLKDRGANGCAGPSGKEGLAGAGFLKADAPAGSLISRTRDGWTWFSVNGRTGAKFKDNEGFYEFDVEVK
jgi:hypothetical protein